MNDLMNENYKDGYYHLGKDLEAFPEAWCFAIWSRRGPGKTYSGLRYYLAREQPFIYLKRTKEDVELICSKAYDLDLSPFKDINRDFNLNIRAIQIHKGFGAFYHCNDNDEPYGQPVAYIMALNAVAKFKGFGLSECEAIIFDEFVPQDGEIVRRAEGKQMLSLYMTVQRDRLKRGRQDLKLILFANSNEISTPCTEILEIVDDMADLQAKNQSHYYNENRRILLHRITEEECPMMQETKSGIFAAMHNTAWGQEAFGGDFAANDFSNVVKLSLKRMQPLIHLHYKNNDWYIYYRESDGMYYMCKSPQKCPLEFDLNLENDQKYFFLNHGIDLRIACIENRFKFQTYSMYNIIVNYKKFFIL